MTTEFLEACENAVPGSRKELEAIPSQCLACSFNSLKSYAENLARLFLWEDTPPGQMYWYNVSNRLIQN